MYRINYPHRVYSAITPATDRITPATDRITPATDRINDRLTTQHDTWSGSKVCFFYNTGGCYRKDGTEKPESECKYYHLKVPYPLTRPQQYRSPCLFYHIDGRCDDIGCKYGHTPNLSAYRRNQYNVSINGPLTIQKEWIGDTVAAPVVCPSPYDQPEKLVELIGNAVKVLSSDIEHDDQVARKDQSKRLIELIMATTSTIINML